jgi:hypothetical protein
LSFLRKANGFLRNGRVTQKRALKYFTMALSGAPFLPLALLRPPRLIPHLRQNPLVVGSFSVISLTPVSAVYWALELALRRCALVRRRLSMAFPLKTPLPV